MEMNGMNNEWEKLKTVDIRTVNKEELVDIEPLLKEMQSGSGADKKRDFIRKLKNPYCFLVGDVVVKSTFTEGVRLEQRVQEVIESL